MNKNNSAKIRIGVDARFYGPKQKGLGRYVQKLLENLEDVIDDNDVIASSAKQSRGESDEIAASRTLRNDRYKFVVFLRKENWNKYNSKNPNFKKVLADCRWYSFKEQFLMPWRIRREKIDLMHFPHFNVPVFCFKPFVVTIHDLILKKFPTRRASTLGFFLYWLKSFAYRIVIFLALKRAKKIIAISNYTKDDILRYFNVNPEKIEVIYEGGIIQSIQSKIVQPLSFPRKRESSIKNMVRRDWIPAFAGMTKKRNGMTILGQFNILKPYLLYVGNAYPHKNLERLILAFDKLNKSCKTKLQLVLVGEIDYFYKRLQEEFAGIPRLIFAGFVRDNELEILYRNAALYVFPSMCEGFGLPPLEAMSYGLPVVSSNATCLPEVLGKAAVYFNPENTEEMEKKIKEVLSGAKTREKLISKGHERVKKYDWGKMSRETMRVYSSIVKKV